MTDTTYVPVTYHNNLWTSHYVQNESLDALATVLIQVKRGTVVEPIQNSVCLPCITVGTKKGYIMAWEGRGVAIMKFTKDLVEITTYAFTSEQEALDFCFSCNIDELIVLQTQNGHRALLNNTLNTNLVVRYTPYIIFDHHSWLAMHFRGAMHLHKEVVGVSYCAASWLARIRHNHNAVFTSVYMEYVSPSLHVQGFTPGFFSPFCTFPGNDMDVNTVWLEALSRGRFRATYPPMQRLLRKPAAVAGDSGSGTRHHRRDENVSQACMQLLLAAEDTSHAQKEVLIESMVNAFEASSLDKTITDCSHLRRRPTVKRTKQEQEEGEKGEKGEKPQTSFIRERDTQVSLQTRWCAARMFAKIHDSTWRHAAWTRLFSFGCDSSSSFIPEMVPYLFRLEMPASELIVPKTQGVVEFSGPGAREAIAWMVAASIAATLRLPMPFWCNAPAFSSLVLATHADVVLPHLQVFLNGHGEPAASMIVVMDATPEVLAAVRLASIQYRHRLYVVERLPSSSTETTMTAQEKEDEEANISITRIAVGSDGKCTRGKIWDGLSKEEMEALRALRS